MSFLGTVDVSFLPALNTTFNALSAILLIVGIIMIRQGRRRAHKIAMLGALTCIVLFLIGYLTYHSEAGHTEFPAEYPVARKVYLAILLPHILLAAVNLPLIIMLVVAAFRGKLRRHRKLARFVVPVWLFVSITGVIIYFMVHHWFVPGSDGRTVEKGNEISLSQSIPAVKGTKVGALVFSPESQMARMEAGQREVTLTYTVVNSSLQAVRIESLESGCECLEVTMSANPIPAGGQAEIRGVFDASHLKGEVDRRILVKVEGQNRPIFLLARIEREPAFTIEPPMTVWRQGGESETKMVLFQVVQKKPIHILSAVSQRPEVECRVIPEEEGRCYRLELTPQTTKGSLLGIVRIETDCELEDWGQALAYYSIR